ncbi:META domain-containing protein [Calidifontimicrobium sp. SYSU G02091]|uniref:META domain-containing protein n=1 Tax=Calidifontimicrobium sp. SYSU G02091 TaxID=2926421 RepID=UPI001F537F52|nr:META domain-containing protein [Calidifontimicrobium sp. SYSU G02091]MCI1192968.1 META domain-containing protein [Calidifontimicrobium sp. SYSU G02091]
MTWLRRGLGAIVAWIGLAMLAGCTGVVPPADALVVTGSLSYRARIALPPDAQAVVELRDVTAPGDGRVVAERRWATQGRQVPLPFELAVDRRALVDGRRYALRAAVLFDGRPAWVSDTVTVDVRVAGPVALGTLWLASAPDLAFASAWQCGDVEVRLGIGRGERVTMTVGARRHEMRQVPTASGARYEAVDDPTTWLWTRGDRATLSLRGRAQPECVAQTPPAGGTTPPTAWTARGHEPSWRLDVDARRLVLELDVGRRRIEVPAPPAQPLRDGWRQVTTTRDGPLAVTVRERVCADVATGMPHPLQVSVSLGARTYSGCGGDPRELLVGDEWRVERLDGRAPVDRSRITLRFGNDGRLTGSASCNRFSAPWQLHGEGLRIGPAVATRMACPPPLMDQEDRFLRLLERVTRFEIAADGALVLVAGDGDRLVARR